MKKRYTVFLFIINVFASFAQPTLTADIVPVPGTILESFTHIDPPFDEGSAGMNQVWDLSGLQPSQPGQVFEYADPDDTPYAAQFPTANLAATTVDFGGNSSYSYFYADNTVFTSLGHQSTSYSSYLTDGIDYFRFPFTYLDQYTDYYAGSNGSDVMSGRLDFTGDAYGTLILPSGTFYNCLRVLEARKDTTISGGDITFISNDTLYHFYSPGYRESLCQVVYHHAIINGYPFDYKGINWRNETPIGIDEVIESPMHVYPNPASDYLMVDDYSSSENLLLINSSGQSFNIPSFREGNHSKIDVTSLPEGLYMIEIKESEGKAMAKFMVYR